MRAARRHDPTLNPFRDPRVAVNRTGLSLGDGIRFDAWHELGQRLARITDASTWWLGDWLVYGQTAFRYRYREALASTGLEYQTLRNYAWVANRVKQSRRRDSLSFQHHAEVASLSELEQERWLRRADEEGWSRNELRCRIRAHTTAPARGTPDPTTVLQILIPTGHEQRWRTAARMQKAPLERWIISSLDAAAASSQH